MAVSTHETYVPESDSTTLDIVVEPECEREGRAQLVAACDRDSRDWFMVYACGTEGEGEAEVSMNVSSDEARAFAEWILAHCK